MNSKCFGDTLPTKNSILHRSIKGFTFCLRLNFLLRNNNQTCPNFSSRSTISIKIFLIQRIDDHFENTIKWSANTSRQRIWKGRRIHYRSLPLKLLFSLLSCSLASCKSAKSLWAFRFRALSRLVSSSISSNWRFSCFTRLLTYEMKLKY